MLIVDAKALYDILVKYKIQSATRAGKGTIEALICRDQHSCCNGTVMWVL